MILFVYFKILPSLFCPLESNLFLLLNCSNSIFFVGNGDTATEKQRARTEANASFIGSAYVQLLRNLYMEWGIPIADLALLADKEGKGFRLSYYKRLF